MGLKEVKKITTYGMNQEYREVVSFMKTDQRDEKDRRKG
jgi:hypothetical protein